MSIEMAFEYHGNNYKDRMILQWHETDCYNGNCFSDPVDS